jgi:hypothetical protein
MESSQAVIGKSMKFVPLRRADCVMDCPEPPRIVDSQGRGDLKVFQRSGSGGSRLKSEANDV